MSTQGVRRGRFGLGSVSVLLIAALGCGGSREEPPAPDSGARTRSAPEMAQPEGAGGKRPAPPPSPAAMDVPHESPEPTFAAPHVLAGKQLGMVVTGKGAAEPNRSLDVLEQQILSLLPQLQEVYEREREQDPGLMGSLDVSLTIEPGGGVSDLRFPLKRVSSEEITAAVFDHMRAWVFPPAENQVQLRFMLLFVPPGLDQASILVWEKQLGSRAVVDRSGETRPPVTVAAVPAPAKKPSPVGSPRPKPVETARAPVSGWYRVTNPTLLHTAPRAASEVVAQLRTGTRVRVVGLVDGEWLEIRSVSNRPPGFLRLEDARPELGEQAG